MLFRSKFEEPFGVQVSYFLLVIRADRQIFEEALAGPVVAIRIVDGEQDSVDSDRMQQADERRIVDRPVRRRIVAALVT